MKIFLRFHTSLFINERVNNMNYPVKYEMDGSYFRVERNGKWENVVFSDLTTQERKEILNKKEKEFAINIADYLATQLYLIGKEYFEPAKE